MSEVGDEDRETQPGAAFSTGGGAVNVWVDGRIHLKAVTSTGEAVELGVAETRGLIRALEHLLLLLE